MPVEIIYGGTPSLPTILRQETFADTICQNTNKFWKRGEGVAGGGWLYSVHFPFWHALVNFSPFTVKLYRCVTGCNSFNDLSKKTSAPNKA